MTTMRHPAREVAADLEATVRLPAQPRRTGRLAVIDGLRLMAALMVALFHFTGLNLADSWGTGAKAVVFPRLIHITSWGWLGVELFFMISGFVICMSCWGRTAGAFARSRVVRLFPAYWPAVLISAAVVMLWPVARDPITVNQLVVNLTMLNEPLKVPSADLSYWTLWAEARFYLLFGLLVWYGLTLERVLWFAYGWLVVAVITVNVKEPLLTTVFQPTYAPYFVAGIAFYLIHRFGSDIRIWGLVALSWAMAMHMLVARVAYEAKALHRPMSLTVGMLIVTLFFVLLGAVALGWSSRVQWRWLTVAGALTYPFYLLHQHIGLTIIHAMQDVRPRLLTLAFVILVMLGAAWLLHRLIEKPLARVLKRKLEQASAAPRDSRRQPHSAVSR
ncbi:acyltransferase family protein [Actinoplanes aureus]|nr:acyltransferase [Actinoplanes aureus]